MITNPWWDESKPVKEATAHLFRYVNGPSVRTETDQPRQESSWGHHGTYLGPVGPRWNGPHGGPMNHVIWECLLVPRTYNYGKLDNNAWDETIMAKSTTTHGMKQQWQTLQQCMGWNNNGKRDNNAWDETTMANSITMHGMKQQWQVRHQCMGWNNNGNHDNHVWGKISDLFPKFNCSHWNLRICGIELLLSNPSSKVHGANMGPIWGWQGPSWPHVGPINLANREVRRKVFIERIIE